MWAEMLSDMNKQVLAMHVVFINLFDASIFVKYLPIFLDGIYAKETEFCVTFGKIKLSL